jgi:hypothetical protein
MNIHADVSCHSLAGVSNSAPVAAFFRPPAARRRETGSVIFLRSIFGAGDGGKRQRADGESEYDSGSPFF